MVKGTQEDKERGAPKKMYSPSRPNLYEDLQYKAVALGLGNCIANFDLNLGVTRRSLKAVLADEYMNDPRVLEALVRRMTSLLPTKYDNSIPFSKEVEAEVKPLIGGIVARKLHI